MGIHFVPSSGGSPRGRTTIAWALAELSAEPACLSVSDHAVLYVVDLPLPTGKMACSPCLHYAPLNSGHVFAAMLPLATHCWATAVDAAPQRQKLPIRILHGARVQYDGRVQLTDGRVFRAVDIIPCRQAHPNELEWAILGALIEARGVQDLCTRVFPYPRNVADQIPECAKVRRIDLSSVHLLEPRLLKQDRFAIAQIAPGMEFSEEKLAQTLDKFGVRIRPPRRRSSLALTTKLPRSPLHGD
jgi:hypothetical protein